MVHGCVRLAHEIPVVVVAAVVVGTVVMNEQEREKQERERQEKEKQENAANAAKSAASYNGNQITAAPAISSNPSTSPPQSECYFCYNFRALVINSVGVTYYSSEIYPYGVSAGKAPPPTSGRYCNKNYQVAKASLESAISNHLNRGYTLESISGGGPPCK